VRIAYLSQGGNSGGPIIHAQTGTVIGIHTNGGCRETDGANFGTRIDVSEIMDHISFLMDKSSPTTTTPTAKPSPNGSSQPSSKSNGLTRSAKSRKEGLAKSRKELFA